VTYIATGRLIITLCHIHRRRGCGENSLKFKVEGLEFKVQSRKHMNQEGHGEEDVIFDRIERIFDITKG
jgi:hypothetical protein